MSLCFCFVWCESYYAFTYALFCKVGLKMEDYNTVMFHSMYWVFYTRTPYNYIINGWSKAETFAVQHVAQYELFTCKVLPISIAFWRSRKLFCIKPIHVRSRHHNSRVRGLYIDVISYNLHLKIKNYPNDLDTEPLKRQSSFYAPWTTVQRVLIVLFALLLNVPFSFAS